MRGDPLAHSAGSWENHKVLPKVIFATMRMKSAAGEAAVSDDKEKAVATEGKSGFFSWRNFAWVLLAAPLFLYWNFANTHLTQFETADEHLWYSQGRIQQYWDALEKHEWKRTRINDKPGITLAIISGLARYWEKEPAPEVNDINRKLQIFPLESIKEAHYNYRIPIVIFNGAMCFYFFWIIRRLTRSEWAALFSATIILLHPIILGISQIINPDALFWTFALALLLTFMAFLESGSVLLFILSLLLLGFTLASKYVGIIFFPFLLLALFVQACYRIPEWERAGEKPWKKMLWRTLAYCAVIWGGIGIFGVLMPAALVNTKYLFKSTIQSHGMAQIFNLSMWIAGAILADAILLRSRIMRFIAKYSKYLRMAIVKLLFLFMAVFAVTVCVNWMKDLGLMGLLDMSFEGGWISGFKELPLHKKIFLEMRPLVFATPPFLLFSLVAVWLIGIFRSWKNEWVIATMTLFIPVFFVAVIQQDLMIHVRYSMVLFPMVSVIAGIGIAEAFDWKFLKAVPKPLVLAGLVALGAQAIISIQPFYFNYTSPLLPKKYSIVDGWGYGGYEVAQFLNSLPEAGTARVVSNYTGVCQFYKGPCICYSDILRPHLRKRWANGSYDYLVINAKGMDRFGFGDKFPEFQEQDSIWKLEIDDRPQNFLKIIESPALVAAKGSVSPVKESDMAPPGSDNDVPESELSANGSNGTEANGASLPGDESGD